MSVTALLLVAALTTPVTESEILQLDRDFDRAIRESDVTFLNGICADSFLFTHGDGVAQPRANFLAAVSAGGMRSKTRAVAGQEIEMHGDVALVTGSVRVTRDLPDPKRADYTIWYVRVYACRGGSWQILSNRTTRSTLTE
jgi:ketosteroid isomerase-like protein